MGITDIQERVAPSTGISMANKPVVPQRWFTMSEDERAVEEWRDFQRNRAGRPSEHVRIKNIVILQRLGARATGDEVQDWWQIFLLLRQTGGLPQCLECDHCGLIEWTEVVNREEKRGDGAGYVIQDLERVEVREGQLVPVMVERYLTWMARDIGGRRYYWCGPVCYLDWERARPRLGRLERETKVRTFVLADGTEVAIRAKATA